MYHIATFNVNPSGEHILSLIQNNLSTSVEQAATGSTWAAMRETIEYSA